MTKRPAVTFDTAWENRTRAASYGLGTSYGSPALKAGGQVFAGVATNKQVDPDTLYVALDFPQRDELVEADPRVSCLRDHYVPWPCVLVQPQQYLPRRAQGPARDGSHVRDVEEEARKTRRPKRVSRRARRTT